MARFIRWGVKSSRSGPQLTMTVLPEKKSAAPVTMAVPNTRKKSRVISPSSSVEGLAGQLRVGDRVKVSYDKLYRTVTYVSAQPIGAVSSTHEKEPMTFTFKGLRRVRHAGENFQTVMASYGPISWNFLLPNRSSGSAPTPDPALMAKVSKLKSGDLVNLEYDPYKYVFSVKDVAVAQLEKKGVFIRTTQTLRGGRKCKLVVVQLSRRTYVMYVPDESDNASEIAASLEGLKPRQNVTVTYSRQGGVYQLASIAGG